MQRAFVISDLHGQMQLFNNFLEHSGYDPGKDRLIVAGDTCDIGNETMAIHEALFEIGAEQLVGNHEISHLCRINIRPYDDTLDPDYIGFVALGIDLGYFKLAAEHDGVLITHAGLSKRLAMVGLTESGAEDSSFKVHYESGTLTAAVAADLLNTRLESRVHIRMVEGEDGPHPLLDVNGDRMWTDWFYPFWFRPYDFSDVGPVEKCGFYDGFKQVVGHTPVGSFNEKQRRLIAESGVTMVDPYARKFFDRKGYCRWALIEDGEVAACTYIPDEED